MASQSIDKLIKGLIYCLAFLPLLIYTGLLFPYTFTKVIFFEVIGLLLLICLAYLIFKREFCFAKKNYLFYVWLIFVGFLFLSSVFGENFYRSFWGNFERMEGIIVYLFLSIYFLAVIIAFRKKEEWYKFFRLNVIVGLLVCGYGFLQKLSAEGLYLLPTVGPRLESTFGNAAFLATYLIFIVYLCLILFFKEEKKNWKIFYILVLLVSLLGILLTETRGAILGLFFGFAAGAVVLLFKLEAKKKVWLGGILIIIIFFTAWLFINRDSDYVRKIPILDRVAHISLEDATVKSRLITWQSSWQGFGDHPILGYGPENQKYAFSKYFDPRVVDQWFDRAHNVIFDLLVAGGILGLVSYLSIFIVAVCWLYKISKNDFILATCLFSLLVAYFFQNLFVFDTIASFILFLSILAYINYLRLDNLESEKIKLKFRGKNFALSVIIIIAVFSSFITVFTPVQASYLAAKGEKLFAKDKNLSYNNFKEALEINTFGQRKIAIGLADRVIFYLNSSEEINKEEATNFFNLARDGLKKALEREPKDMQLILILALLYQSYSDIDSGYLDEAINIVEDNIELSPNRPEVYYSLAQSYLIKKDNARVIEYLWQAQKIIPKRDLYLKMALVYSQTGDASGMVEIYNGYRKDFPEVDFNELKKVANYFFTAEFYKEAIPIVELIIEAEPDNPNNYISLAAIYSETGDKEKARQAVLRILEINPAYEPQVEEFLNNLQ